MNEELISEQGATDSENLPPEDIQHTESLPVGCHLQIIHYDNEEVLNETDTETTSILPSAESSRGVPSGRYPRREHQPPTRFNNFVALNCVEDKTSSQKRGWCNSVGHVHTHFETVNTCSSVMIACIGIHRDHCC